MSTQAAGSRFAAALLHFAAAMERCAWRARAAARWVDARRMRRRMHDAHAVVGQHELFDIGLAHIDPAHGATGPREEAAAALARRRFDATPPRAGRALIACALWLHVGYVGTAIMAAALIRLYADEGRWAPGLAIATCGVVLAVSGLVRARSIADQAMTLASTQFTRATVECRAVDERAHERHAK